MLVDTLGLLVAVLMTSAALDDGVAAPQLVHRITTEAYPRLQVIFGDRKYRNHAFKAWLAAQRPCCRVEAKLRPEGAKSFTPLANRWVVERTNAWNVLDVVDRRGGKVNAAAVERHGDGAAPCDEDVPTSSAARRMAEAYQELVIAAAELIDERHIEAQVFAADRVGNL